MRHRQQQLLTEHFDGGDLGVSGYRIVAEAPSISPLRRCSIPASRVIGWRASSSIGSWRAGNDEDGHLRLRYSHLRRSTAFSCRRDNQNREIMKKGGRCHFRYLSEGKRERGGAAEAYICRGLRDCTPRRELIDREGYSCSLPPGLEGQSRFHRENAADRANRRCRATGKVTYAEVHLRIR